MNTTKTYYARYSTAMELKSGGMADINYGQAFRYTSPHQVCRKTGLIEDNGSRDFMDRGALVQIQLIGGQFDGAEGECHDVGGLSGCIGCSEKHPEGCDNPTCYDCHPG